MSFDEAISKDFEYIKVTHPLITKMDYIRIGMGGDENGFTTLKNIIAYLCMFKDDEMKEIIRNGKWSVKEVE